MAALTTACIGTCIAAAIGVTPAVIAGLGFGAGGVAAGSVAAWLQSTFIGGTIAGGGVFATLQSLGAAGLGVKAYGAIVATCTASCAAVGLNATAT